MFNQSNCSYLSLEVVVYLFLSLKWWQSTILWSVLCHFHSLYHCSHSLSLIVILCHSLSPFVTCCTTCCHSLSLAAVCCHSLSFVVTGCTTRSHSLSFVVTCCTTRCHSLSLVIPLVVNRCHSLSFVVTRCTTRLSFYKRS